MILAIVWLSFLNAGCGGDSTSSPQPQPVNNPSLTSLAVSPSNAKLQAPQTQQFKAVGTFSDGSTQDLTNSVTWSSSAPFASIDSTTGLAAGGPVPVVPVSTATIQAVLSGVTAATNLTVTSAVGTEQEFPLPNYSNPREITSGPDGNLWFTEQLGNNIGRVTTTGAVTEFSVPTGGSLPTEITAGADGNLWFTEGSSPGKIGQITTSGLATEFPVLTANSTPNGITADPDGNLWFTETSANNIGRITTGGVVTEIPIPTPNSGPTGITAGPDGNLWFTEFGAPNIGRITPSGVITEFPITGSGAYRITAGPDGNLWIAFFSSAIGRMTPSGVITLFPQTVQSIFLFGITAGPDGNLWFPVPGTTNGGANFIGVIAP